MVTRSDIKEYLDFLLKTEVYDADLEMSIWIDTPFEYTQSVTRCTTSARLVAYKFNGAIWGYAVDDIAENKEIIGYDCMGHDFAIVGRFLVDYWAAFVNECGDAILDMTNPDDILKIKKHYLPLSKWTTIPINI